MVLPFLPPNHTPDAFNAMRERCPPQAKPLMDYVEAQWLNNAVFHVKSWNVFDFMVRTNNDVEGTVFALLKVYKLYKLCIVKVMAEHVERKTPIRRSRVRSPTGPLFPAEAAGVGPAGGEVGVMRRAAGGGVGSAEGELGGMRHSHPSDLRVPIMKVSA